MNTCLHLYIDVYVYTCTYIYIHMRVDIYVGVDKHVVRIRLVWPDVNYPVIPESKTTLHDQQMFRISSSIARRLVGG